MHDDPFAQGGRGGSPDPSFGARSGGEPGAPEAAAGASRAVRSRASAASARLHAAASASDRLRRLAEPTAIRDVSDADFDDVVLRAGMPVLVDFWAETCVPCRLQEPVIEALARELARRVLVVRLDVFGSPRVPERFRIKGVPHLLVIRDGAVVLDLVGAYGLEPLRARLRAAQVC